MFLIVGLGNPGPKYKNTRHNVGFKAIYTLAEELNINSTSNKFKAIVGQGRINNEKVLLAQPLTYMNNSGESVRLIIDYYKIPLEHIVIIYDDLDLPTGKIRVKENGSAGGHNGLKSIINNLGTQEIPRIRIGIDSPQGRISVIDYVLGHFSTEEKKVIDESLDKIYDIVKEIIINGYQTAMNKYN
ncbi:MAG: aminoacyl-tRNA hydrolase [Halanaerobiales bacterium]